MLKFLSLSFKAGFGLTAITAAILWAVHEGFLKAKVFSVMTPEQTFNAFIWSTGLSAALLFFSLILSAVTNQSAKSIKAETGGIAIDNSGCLNFFKFLKDKSDNK